MLDEQRMVSKGMSVFMQSTKNRVGKWRARHFRMLDCGKAAVAGNWWREKRQKEGKILNVEYWIGMVATMSL